MARARPAFATLAPALESAIAQPKATFGGIDLYPTLVEKVAALGFALVQNHPFVDANKRVGHAAMETFLRPQRLRDRSLRRRPRAPHARSRGWPDWAQPPDRVAPSASQTSPLILTLRNPAVSQFEILAGLSIKPGHYPCWALRRSSFPHTRDIEPSVRADTLDNAYLAPIGGKRERSNPYGWSPFGCADRWRTIPTRQLDSSFLPRGPLRG